VTWLDGLTAHAHGRMTGNVREQLWQRGVSDEQIDGFQIGCLPGAKIPSGIEVSPRFMSWWTTHSSQFGNALVFPLTSTLGSIHGLQFRDLNPKVRGYLDYFETKEEPAFFGLAQAMPSVWETEKVWLVEGVFDLCPLQRHVPNVISTMHAGVSKQLARVLHRLARTLLIAYDMDSTGLSVSYDLARDLKGLFEVVVVKFPRVRLSTGGSAKDPNDLWSAWGDSGLGAFLQRSMRLHST
jgi:DNA primase